MRLIRLLPWLLLVVLVVFSVATFPSLPPVIPQKIDFSGQVVKSAPRSAVSWGMLPLVAALTQLLLAGVRHRLQRQPELFNFSAKDAFLKLPAEFRPPIVAKMQEFMDVTAAVTMLIMLGVQVMMWHTAKGGRSEVATIVLLIGSVLIVPLVFLLQQGVVREVEQATRTWESRRNPLAHP